MNPRHRLNPRTLVSRCSSSLLYFILTFALGCSMMACSGNSTPKQRVSSLQLLAVDGDRLILVSPDSGEHRDLVTSSMLRDVSALAFDSVNKVAYAIADASTAPRLLRITLDSGEVAVVGPIRLPPISASTADALVYDTENNRLLVAAGGKGLSSYLLSLDPQTGDSTRLGRIRKTPQGELDALALARGVVYATDFVSEETHFFQVALGENLVTSTPIGKISGKVTDLAAEPTSGRLFLAIDGRLASVRTHGELSVIPYSKAPALTALALISSGPTLFANGFEAGDLAAWSEIQN